jgi:hypothetical protein
MYVLYIIVCPCDIFLLAIVLSVFWPLCCLFFIDLRFLVTPLVSPYSSDIPYYNLIHHIERASSIRQTRTRWVVLCVRYLAICTSNNILQTTTVGSIFCFFSFIGNSDDFVIMSSMIISMYYIPLLSV